MDGLTLRPTAALPSANQKLIVPARSNRNTSLLFLENSFSIGLGVTVRHTPDHKTPGTRARGLREIANRNRSEIQIYSEDDSSPPESRKDRLKASTGEAPG